MKKNYHDRELNRLLAEADELLSDVNVNLYETPAETQVRLQEEANRAEAEAKRQAEQEALRAEAEAKRQAEQEALRAEAEAKRQAEQEALREEAEAKRQAEQEALRAEAEAKRQAEQEAIRMEAEAKRQAEQEAIRMEAEVKQQAEQEALREEAEAKRQAEQEALRMEAEEAGQETACREEKKQSINILRDSVWGSVAYAAMAMVYMEILLHLAIYDSLDTNLFQTAAFAAAGGCLTVLAISWVPEKANHIVCMILLLLGSVWFDFQIVSHSWNASYALLNMDIGYSLQVLRNLAPALQSTGADMVWMLLMFLPVILFGIFGRKWIPLRKSGWMNRILMGMAGALLVTAGFLCVEAHGTGTGTPYETFCQFDSNMNQEQAAEQLGITGTVLLECMEYVSR